MRRYVAQSISVYPSWLRVTSWLAVGEKRMKQGVQCMGGVYTVIVMHICFAVEGLEYHPGSLDSRCRIDEKSLPNAMYSIPKFRNPKP